MQLVGIVDADTALSHRYAQQFHLDPSLFYAQLDAMIAARHPQALLVYTSVGKHREVIEAAAQHGLSVMVEKPLTMSLEDALAIRRAAREHHIQVLVNYETTWYASNRAAYDEVAKGALGDLRRIVVHDGHEGPKEIGVPPEFLKWLEDPEQNGDGALYDFGCYGADLVTWLMHGESPLSVTAVTQTDKPQIYPRVADEATIIVRYPKAQAVLMAFLELAVWPQGHGSVWGDRIRHHGWAGQAAPADQRSGSGERGHGSAADAAQRRLAPLPGCGAQRNPASQTATLLRWIPTWW